MIGALQQRNRVQILWASGWPHDQADDGRQADKLRRWKEEEQAKESDYPAC